MPDRRKRDSNSAYSFFLYFISTKLTNTLINQKAFSNFLIAHIVIIQDKDGLFYIYMAYFDMSHILQLKLLSKIYGKCFFLFVIT